MQFEFQLRGKHRVVMPNGERKTFTKGDKVDTTDINEAEFYTSLEDSFKRMMFKVVKKAAPPMKPVQQQMEENMRSSFEEGKESAVKARAEAMASVQDSIEANRKLVEKGKNPKAYAPEPTEDEFGPLKGTEAYKKLKQGEKIRLGTQRKERDKELAEQGKSDEEAAPPVDGPSLADLDD